MNIDSYLYEIIEEYKEADSEKERVKIFNDFCSVLWRSKNKRRTYTKTIRFKVREDLLETDIGKVFNTWSEIEYKGYKSTTGDDDWCSLIRQKINNLYTRYFDKGVILNKEYMDVLNIPKKLYYKWIHGEEINIDELTCTIDESYKKSIELKSIYEKQKMNLSWDDYKELIEGFLRKTFDNCILIDDYEDKTKLINLYDFVLEDNFYIKYICKSLESYMRNYQKKYYGLYVPSTTKQNKKFKRCKECGALIEVKGRNTQYCVKCKEIKRKESKRNWWNKTH